MPTLAIVGAGPGMGRAIAQTFGRNGFQVALVARNQAKLTELVAQLEQEGITAAGFTADVSERSSLVAAFAAIKARFGPVDVLEFSPANAALPSATPTEVSIANLQPQIDFYIYGAITAVEQVLPDMLARGSGTLLFTTGGSSISPSPMFANIGIASAGLRNWVYSLHAVLAEHGIQAAHIAISAWIGQQPGAAPENIAPLYWELYSQRDQIERHFLPG
ncbi:SDR family NAD(P)-dependent oxidoreductase [Herpetosiphon geysericola]|uniref:Short-chain dehydrogenase n=1 Tax=Herpetosiphon geysericola TaxID=70996 RepID=A0A0P6YMK8_9CHLR|nr:SDR family NAD(P)-dependent oxidoreductase [Herpetosiphon geysericola]KPL91462.1 short-chain dehydrogenase [Herpetosiphon geysericola]